jgi:hypothetical protein
MDNENMHRNDMHDMQASTSLKCNGESIEQSTIERSSSEREEVD